MYANGMGALIDPRRNQIEYRLSVLLISGYRILLCERDQLEMATRLPQSFYIADE